MAAQPRRAGRTPKPEGERLQPLSTSLPPADHDFLCLRAMRRGISLAELTREMLTRQVSQLKNQSVT